MKADWPDEAGTSGIGARARTFLGKQAVTDQHPRVQYCAEQANAKGAGYAASACLLSRWWPMAAAPASTCAGIAATCGRAPSAGTRVRQDRPHLAKTRRNAGDTSRAGNGRRRRPAGASRTVFWTCIHRSRWENERAPVWTLGFPDLHRSTRRGHRIALVTAGGATRPLLLRGPLLPSP